MKSVINFIDSDVLLLEEKNPLKAIELAGRTCYKSEDKISEDSAEKFVKMLCSRGHTAMTEFGTVYITFTDTDLYDTINNTIANSKYSSAKRFNDNIYVTTNFRVIYQTIESFCDIDSSTSDNIFELACDYVNTWGTEPTIHERRFAFRFICDRGVSHELVRHRVMSFAQESTRYCNYGNKGFQFVKPAWWDSKLGENGNLSFDHTIFMSICQTTADTYMSLLQLGQTPQQARAVLPNAIKTEVCVAGFISQWQEWLKLRDDKAAHPDMQVVAKKVRSILEFRGIS